MTSLENLAALQEAIAQAALDAGREPSSVTLVAVSKTVPADRIEPVLQAGQRVFGENYVQESAAKWPALREAHPGCELHLLGPLQSNKAQAAVALFDVIHSLDRPSLAAALATAQAKTGRRPRVLCQVNTGEEPQKGGVPPSEVDSFVLRCRTEFGLDVAGLMCIPPADQAASPHFALLKVAAERNGLPWLSMGMSADFREAIQLGATHVRVGTAIFGARLREAPAEGAAPRADVTA
ncbi:YggS family pyridoxal phosphate-dependent enzyme [Enterovirga sp.]|jgi:pyridoxal phosphate enzyme (YggS family)|uniref:YggS family pyridoxal phosphate-dependent enzyme n=1 Tax=Enterovirga sp. TaxID=2026350 RepID=UPI00262D3BA9|nr:YggS family pyridoxal phosphate-dependent enzyme [Enterovirga sp.]MDB5590216.1 alanine racemase domain protein [Enterovirga sp.]